jgi:hypothetical protein
MAKGKTMIQRQQQFQRLQLILFALGVSAPMIALLIGGWLI